MSILAVASRSATASRASATTAVYLQRFSRTHRVQKRSAERIALGAGEQVEARVTQGESPARRTGLRVRFFRWEQRGTLPGAAGDDCMRHRARAAGVEASFPESVKCAAFRAGMKNAIVRPLCCGDSTLRGLTLGILHETHHLHAVNALRVAELAREVSFEEIEIYESLQRKYLTGAQQFRFETITGDFRRPPLLPVAG